MYLIFGGQSFYANGGINDLIETHDDKSHAIQRAVELIGLKAVTYKCNPEDIEWDEDQCHEIEWTQVYDVDNGDVIYKSEVTPFGDNDGVIEVVG